MYEAECLPKSESKSRLIRLLETPTTQNFQEKEMAEALDNGIRGRIEFPKITFLDLAREKEKRLRELAEIARNGKRVEEVVRILWRIAISDEPGQDINWQALRLLESLPKIPQGFKKELETYWQGGDGLDLKKACFAAKIILSHEAEGSQSDRLKELANSACFWNPEIAERKIANAILIMEGDEQTYTSLVLYRRLMEELSQRDHVPRLSNAVQEGLREAIGKIDRTWKRFKRFRLAGSLVTLGTELQGGRPGNVPIVTELEGHYSSLAPSDYYRIMNLGGFIPSGDKLWELALPPSDNPTIQALIIQELRKLGFIPTEREPISLHITVGGLKSSRKHREPAALQLMMLAAGDVTDPRSLGEASARQQWYLWPGKTALRNRSSRELIPTKTEPKVAAEMRIPSLIDFSKAYRVLLTLLPLAAAAKEHQNKIDHQQFSLELSDYWNSLVGEINEIFSEFGLPSVVKLWNFHELEKLKELLESDNGKSFSRRIKRTLARHRLKITSVLRKKEVPFEKRIEDKSLNVLLKTIRKWRDVCRKKIGTTTGLFNHEFLNFKFLIGARRYTLAVPIWLSLVEMTKGASPEQTVRTGLFFLIPFLISNPDVLVKVPETIASILKREPTLEIRKTIKDLNSLCLGVNLAAIPLGFSAAVAGQMGPLINGLVIYALGYIGKRLLRHYEPIEKYEL